MNLNLARFSSYVMPHLGIVDGFIGMEGDGPVSGDPIDFRVAATSLFPTSLDAVVSRAMGFDPLKIGYLYHLNKNGKNYANLKMIKIVGTSIENIEKKFKPHPDYQSMLDWK